MRASLVICKNVLRSDSVEVKPITRRRRISSLAPDTKQPFICIYNGQPLLRKDWGQCVGDNDVVTFIIRPPQGGGGGSNPMKLILTIGLMYATGPLASAITGMESGLMFSLVKAGIGLAGNALINSAFGTPNQPSNRTAADLAAPSPTYDLSAQGNVSRLGDPIPVQYGTLKTFPNYAAEPYAEYAGNEQYLYQLLCITQGYADIDAIFIGDTPISSFPEVTYEVVQPGGSVTLFPDDVHTSSDVTGQEVLTTQGPFVANPAGSQTNALAVDIVLPRGLFFANDEGGMDARSITFTVEAQAINNSGAAIGVWQALGSHTLTFATNTAQRVSYRYPVALGRYQVRVTRNSGKDTSSRVGNDLNWTALRAYFPGSRQYGDITLLAMRMRATNSLSSTSSRKINVIATRKLPIWNGSAWSAPQRTQSIAWAAADMCRAKYGAGYTDNRIDLAQLLALDTTFAARGDKFNALFDNSVTFWEALQTCLIAGRTKPFRQSGNVHFVRDQPRTLPVCMFNMLNTVKGSFSVNYIMPTDDTADAVEVEYFDETIWNWDYVTCKLPDSTASTPAKVKLFGVTSRNQAWREGMYLAARNKWRRTHATIGSEAEGFIPSFGDLTAIQHDRPQWGQGGEILGWDSATRTVTLSEPLTWAESGNHYFAFQYRDGSVSDAYLATQGTAQNQAVLDVPLTFVPDIGLDRERTRYAFGIANKMYMRMLVSAIRPRDGNHSELDLEIEDDRIHAADATGSAGSTSPGSNLPVVITRPSVGEITVNLSADATEVNVSWPPSPGAEKYAVELSYDDGASWTRKGEPVSSQLTFAVMPGAIKIRVAALGLTQGDWAVWSGDIYSNIVPLPNVQGFTLVQPFVGRSLKVKWSATAGADYYAIDVYDTASMTKRRSVSSQALDYEYTYEDARADGGPWRSVTLQIKAKNSAGASSMSFASLIASNPQISVPGGVFATASAASVVVGATKPADTDFAGMLIYGSTVSGFTPGSGNLMYDGPEASRILAPLAAGVQMYFRVAFYDTFGVDNLNLSTEVSATPLSLGGVATVNEIPTTTFAGDVVYCLEDQNIYEWVTDHYVQASPLVAATRIVAASLSAISANLGNITGGSMNIADKFIVANDGSVTIQSGPTGARKVSTNRVDKVFDAAGVLRMRCGDLSL